MKILHIPTGGLFSDGIGTFIYSYLEYMDLNKYDVTILATNSPLKSDKEKFECLGVKVIEIERKKSNLSKYVYKLKKIIKKEKFDIIHVHGSSALMSIELLTAKVAGIPVRIAHSHNTTCEHHKLDKLLRPIFYRVYTQACACSVSAGQWLFEEKNYKIIHNARDVNRYQYDAIKRKKLREELLLSDETIALGHVGRFNTQKNQCFLVSLMEKLVIKNIDIKLFLVGTGDTLEEIKKLVIQKKLEDNIVFLGQFDDMKSFVSSMDIMLFPSLYEGLPLVSVEWQINGVESILSDRVTQECIYTGTVQQLSIDSMELWEKEILNLSTSDRERVSLQNIQLIKNAGYDISLEVKEIEELYNSLYDIAN
ncbi:TPA: glycosyltransferase family 1 protein [Streptococcus pneumoniae]